MITFKGEEKEKHIDFTAEENGVSCGQCILALEEKYAVISEVTFTSDKPYTAEGLIRSALNYAALRGYYMALVTDESVKDILHKMGFIKTDRGYECDIPTALMGQCCK